LRRTTPFSYHLETIIREGITHSAEILSGCIRKWS
jgi:hypothetical protein